MSELDASAPPSLFAVTDPSLFINREISWLSFNARVLGEAADRRWPIMERLKFVAIHASNLDEFFMIRVSGLHEQLEARIGGESPDGLTPAEQLVQIRQIVLGQIQRASALLSEEILPGLADAGIRIHRWDDLDSDARRAARDYFRREVFPVLTPLVVDPGHPFPFLSNLSLSLAVEVRDPDTGDERFARVKVPEILPRFVSLRDLSGPRPAADAFDFLPMEELIAANLGDLFVGMDIAGCYPFRITRDMDLDVLEDEAHDLLSVIDSQVRRRKFGAVVRLEVAPGLPAPVRRLLLAELEIDAEDLYECSGPLGSAAFFSLVPIGGRELRNPTFLPNVPPALAESADLFGAIRARDILLHHPYDSFQPVLDLLRRAATDPRVLAIKMTLYRTGSDSRIVQTLIQAAENGKQVAVLIELKARFDEQTNIDWARLLERAGVHVFYGSAELKTHAKLALVVRREDAGIVHYVHLSTGNYNPVTAQVYTDLGLLTADREIGEDVAELFNSLSGYSRIARYRRIVVAPETLHETILARIEEQAARAREERPAAIFAKMNSLVDGHVIRALYRASQAGVSIVLDVRGICCLRPGIPGVSENIQVFSIVGRFLEHSRVFIFGPRGEEEYFLSSADWMPRNFHRRIEVMFQISDKSIQERIRAEIVEPTLLDNCRAQDLGADGISRRRVPRPGEPEIDAQLSFLEGARRRGLRAVETPGTGD